VTKRGNDTFWIELGFLPIEVGYVPDAKAWRASLKRLKVEPMEYPDTDGRCVRWTNVGPERKDIVLICVGERSKNYSVAQVTGIIAHECMHAWKYVREAMQETEPSTEFEAYAMQCLVQHAVYAHMTKRKRPWKKPK
jgi:hypothetical protein